MSETQVKSIIDKCTKGRFSVFWRKRVNVLKVNLMLDGVKVKEIRYA